MSETPYCPSHTKRIEGSGVNRFYFDTFVVQFVFERHMDWFNHPEWCYLCKVSDNQLVEWLKKAAEMEANVEAGGGSYTTEKLAVFRGGTENS